MTKVVSNISDKRLLLCSFFWAIIEMFSLKLQGFREVYSQYFEKVLTSLLHDINPHQGQPPMTITLRKAANYL